MKRKKFFRQKEQSSWIDKQLSLKVGCLLYAVGKQPTLPRINHERNERQYNDEYSLIIETRKFNSPVTLIRLSQPSLVIPANAE